MTYAKKTTRFINPLTFSLSLKYNFKDLLTTLVSALDQELLSVTNDEGIDDVLGIAAMTKLEQRGGCSDL